MIFIGKGYAQNRTENSAVELSDGTFAEILKLFSSDPAFALVKLLQCTTIKYSSVQLTHLLRVFFFPGAFD